MFGTDSVGSSLCRNATSQPFRLTSATGFNDATQPSTAEAGKKLSAKSNKKAQFTDIQQEGGFKLRSKEG